jgi:CRP-like cAMP-binding protein
MQSAQGETKNFILDSLLPTDAEWLRPNLKDVELQQEHTIYQVGAQITDVYFPTTCLFSLTNLTELGEIVEVGVTGSEGVVGVPLLLGEDRSPWNIQVQLPGSAFKLPPAIFVAAIDRSAALRQRVAAFTYLKLMQLSQSAVCNRFHSAEARLCRWLLTAQDRTKTSEFSFTHDILAEMIGAGRPTVSIVTGTLQSAGLIRANRGNITIVNQEGMEDAACECYQIGKDVLNKYLAKKIQF